MAIYAIGDLQGCLDPLQHLLKQIRFDPTTDYLWFVGDLVNRGPQSLATLRYVYALGERAVTVLGNHDLHLLAIDAGVHRVRTKDTVQDILDAHDREPLMHWLRHRPLLHHAPTLDWVMIHAGLPPQWDLETAKTCAQEFESVLQGNDYRTLLSHMYGDDPSRWRKNLTRWQRLRFTSNCLTRLRCCTENGHLDMHYKGLMGKQPPHLLPWFQIPKRASAAMRIVCGHWSALGYYNHDNVLALDTGCIWGGSLTAVRLDDPDLSLTQVSCQRMSQNRKKIV